MTVSPHFGVRIVHHASQTLITVEGDLDLSTAPLLQSRLKSVIADADGVVLLDFADVTYIESSGLSVILSAHSTLDDQGRGLHVVKASPQVRRLFDLCRVTHLLADRKPVGVKPVSAALG